jgi:hypothetical protein
MVFTLRNRHFNTAVQQIDEQGNGLLDLLKISNIGTVYNKSTETTEAS